MRRVMGAQKEDELSWCLTRQGIPFDCEQDLRDKGFSRTPDFRLLAPVAIRGHIVCWIDSKACFGDPGTHNTLLTDQLRTYVHRFGPGAVVYWFGHVQVSTANLCLPMQTSAGSAASAHADERGDGLLPADPDILVLDHWPAEFVDLIAPP